jgi:hypothetical protein
MAAAVLKQYTHIPKRQLEPVQAFRRNEEQEN